jgi:virginiamycin B lyase
MRMKTILLASAAALMAFVLHTAAPALAQNAAALSGAVTSAKEGPMEGVVISARKDGATITVSVVTDDKGHFSFPASRLDPGHYAIGIRATGYDLDGPKDATIAAGLEDKIDVTLKPARNLSAQLTNAEWLMSMPGTDDQKRLVLDCNSCHSLERIVRSTHDAAEFQQVFLRMAGYYPRQHAAEAAATGRRCGAPAYSCRPGAGRRGMARRHQFECAGYVELPAQDAAAAHRQIDPCHHHRIRHAE